MGWILLVLLCILFIWMHLSVDPVLVVEQPVSVPFWEGTGGYPRPWGGAGREANGLRRGHSGHSGHSGHNGHKGHS